MLAFMHPLFPLALVLLGAAAGAVIVAACTPRKGGKKKAEIAALKARIEALERRP
jgi:hypothetical protein